MTDESQNARRESANRRETERRPAAGEIELELETRIVRGRGENLSRSGAFFYSGDELRVRLRIEGEERVRTGRLVRLERVSHDETGFAVELDPD